MRYLSLSCALILALTGCAITQPLEPIKKAEQPLYRAAGGRLVLANIVVERPYRPHVSRRRARVAILRPRPSRAAFVRPKSVEVCMRACPTNYESCIALPNLERDACLASVQSRNETCWRQCS